MTGGGAPPGEPRTGYGREDTGRRGERLASEWLRASGYDIIARNWRSGRYEIDLVVRTDDTICFVEVKTRRRGPQRPHEALSPAQRRRLRRAGEAWIHSHPGVGREFRFDLVAIEVERGHARVTHLPNAFFGDEIGV